MTIVCARVALVLAGGNALGAYQAGVYQALHEAGVAPEWIVGTSVGAINGAIIAGNAPADRLAKLTAFWRPAEPGYDPWHDGWRRTSEVVATVLGGRPGLCGPIGSGMFGAALFDTAPLVTTLSSLVDFGRLNDGLVRYMATVIDLESGADVVFDTRRDTIDPRHVRASGALPPSFPPIAVDGRLLADGGLSANLALDPVLSDPGEEPLLCIAVDLLPSAGGRPRTIGEAAGRMQDVLFAAQARRAIGGWRERYDHDSPFAACAVTLAHLAYADQAPEVGGKAMDFSPLSVRRRWDVGYRDGRALLATVTMRREPGLHVVTGGGGSHPPP